MATTRSDMALHGPTRSDMAIWPCIWPYDGYMALGTGTWDGHMDPGYRYLGRPYGPWIWTLDTAIWTLDMDPGYGYMALCTAIWPCTAIFYQGGVVPGYPVITVREA